MAKAEETKTRIIAITIPNDLLAALDQAANREDRTRSNMICRLLKYSLTDRMEGEEDATN